MIEHKAAARNCGAGKVHLKNETVTAGTRLAFLQAAGCSSLCWAAFQVEVALSSVQ